MNQTHEDTETLEWVDQNLRDLVGKKVRIKQRGVGTVTDTVASLDYRDFEFDDGLRSVKLRSVCGLRFLRDRSHCVRIETIDRIDIVKERGRT